MRAGYPLVLVAGVDEVGRGCLAGPVVAGALVLPSSVDFEANPWLFDIADSKLLSHEERERLDPLIRAWAPTFAIGVATVEEIDRINIFHASHLAMVRAVNALSEKPRHVLVDGKFLPRDLSGFSTAVIAGDLKCLSIACASIVAKVFRDRMMVEQDGLYPGYGFAAHKGYGTPFHYSALRELGLTDLHRRSFGPIREMATARDSVKARESLKAGNRADLSEEAAAQSLQLSFLDGKGELSETGYSEHFDDGVRSDHGKGEMG